MYPSHCITFATAISFATQVFSHDYDATYKHVAVFSVDGLHSSDVEKYVKLRPESTIGSLLATGFEYTSMAARSMLPMPALLISP